MEATINAKSKLVTTLGVKCGSSENHKIDVYSSVSTPSDAPIFVYVHGGYWQEISVDSCGFMAVPLVDAGAKVIVVEYDLTPKVSMEEIVVQVKESIVAIARMAVQTKSRGVYLSGHSAGAHLVARAFDADLRQSLSSAISRDAADFIKGAILFGGIYDLRPLTFTSENVALRMTLNSAWNLSPTNQTNLEQLVAHWHHLRFVIAVAEQDSPEFRLQSETYHQLISDLGFTSKYVDCQAVDHFNMVENLQEDEYNLTKEILDVLGLNRNEAETARH